MAFSLLFQCAVCWASARDTRTKKKIHTNRNGNWMSKRHIGPIYPKTCFFFSIVECRAPHMAVVDFCAWCLRWNHQKQKSDTREIYQKNPKILVSNACTKLSIKYPSIVMWISIWTNQRRRKHLWCIRAQPTATLYTRRRRDNPLQCVNPAPEKAFINGDIIFEKPVGNKRK